jgi:hypothetical protein
VPKLFVPILGPSGLLPKFVSTLANIFFGGVFHSACPLLQFICKGQYSLGCFPIAQPPREGAVFISFGAKVGLAIFHGKLSPKSKTTKRLRKFTLFELFQTRLIFEILSETPFALRPSLQGDLRNCQRQDEGKAAPTRDRFFDAG